MDSIPSECQALGHAVFSDAIYLFIIIIYDIILTIFLIILSTWLYNYYTHFIKIIIL